MCSSNTKEDCDEFQGGQQRSHDQQDRLSLSAHISRDQIEDLEQENDVFMPTQEEDRVPRTIDVSELNDEELAQLRVTDPFMYYSIPSIRNGSLRGSLTSSEGSSQGDVGPGGRQLQHRRLSAPTALISAATGVAAETTVRRRSRISFELCFDEVMKDFIESMDEGAGNDDESFDDILDRLSNS